MFNSNFKELMIKLEIPQFNFYGGARDVLVPTPSQFPQGELSYVTTEIYDVYESLDHNSLLYNVKFLNCLVPVITETMKQGELNESK